MTYLKYLKKSELGALTDGWMERRAAELGLVPDVADDTTLQLDVDSDTAMSRFSDGLRLLKSLAAEHGGIVDVLTFDEPVILPSKSGAMHRHVWLKLRRPLPIGDRIALQAILGSDPERELLALAGAWHGKAKPVVLFRPSATP
jgi:hypothetical protein